jgi:tetratricopeptide (TPR) repeat protein
MSDAQNFSSPEGHITAAETAHLVGMLNARRYADSESDARGLLSKYPNCGFTWKALGVSLWMQGKDARPVFHKVTTLHPNDAEAHSNLGHVLLEFDQLDQAVQSCRRALELNPQLAEAHCNLGNALRRLGQVGEAITSYRAALQLQPHLASAHNNLGTALQATGHLDEAVASYRSALTAKPDFAEAHSNLGNALRAQGQFAEAVTSFRRALTIRPAFPEAHSNLGNAFLALNQQHDAVASYRKALELNPGYAEAHNNLGNALLSIGKLDDAVLSCLRALQINPKFSEAYNNLGNTYRRLGQLDDAVGGYQQALAIKPEYAEAHNNLGNVLLQLWRVEEAVASYRHSLQIKPGYAEAHNNLAIALLHLWQVDEAMASCRRALEIRPDYAEAHNTLGNALEEISELHQAESSFRRAVALQPTFAEAHSNLGFALRRLRRPDEAEWSARRALEINPQLIDAYALLAELSADSGDFVKAEHLLRQASSLEPNAPTPLASLSGMHKMTHDDAGWLANVRRVLAQPLSPRHEAGLRYALGKYFDDAGEYDEAFANYRRANDLVKRHGPKYDGPAETHGIDRAIETYNEGWVNRPRNSTRASSRAVFIVGTPRSGTTLAEQILASHPSVFGAGEQVFWCAKGMAIRPSSLETDLCDASIRNMAEEYLQLLERLSADALRVIDKLSANYLNLGLIHAALPEARIIHMRRDPLDSCLSIYFHPFSIAHNYANDLGDLAHYYSKYARVMAHWRSILPREVLLEVPYEALVSDQEQWSRRMIDFIGLPWDARCMDYHATKRPVIIINSRWQVRQRISRVSMERWRNYEKFITPLRPLAELDRATPTPSS